MKRINTYITEKLHINKDVKKHYKYFPKTQNELISDIQDKIEKEGLGTGYMPLDLNDIDTSKITDMSYLFDGSGGPLKELSENGNFDISLWDVSNVKHMECMFAYSNFDGDISLWDVSNVKYMQKMFMESAFTGRNGDISNWDVSNVTNMFDMFTNNHNFNIIIPKWYKTK